MHRTSNARVTLIIAVASLLVAACGNDGAEGRATASTSTTTASPVDDEAWRDEAVAWCASASGRFASTPFPTSDADLPRYISDFIDQERGASTDPVPAWPRELTEAPYDLDAIRESQDEWLERADQQLAAGDVGSLLDLENEQTALGSIDNFVALAGQAATTLATMGVRCGPADPARTARAALNVPILTAWQVSVGFGSVWVSNRAEQQVHRIDPETGETEAVIDVGSVPLRSQPADGRMVLRTFDTYQFIDPVTNTITDTLPRTDVGAGAGNAWAIDGALWICDGQQVHRYDPTTLERVATVPLDMECAGVHVTEDVVIPWNTSEAPGESGNSAAAFIDPATNSVRTTFDLPVDVGRPVVLDDVIFFPASEGPTSVVVDAATGAVTATPQLGRPYVHSNSTDYDGTHLYVIVEGRDIAVVDPTTFEIVETIEPMDFDPPFSVQVNGLAVGQGALWVVNDAAAILQRFDRPS